jgi:HTH-type transcriptional regulator/antitoxin HigA
METLNINLDSITIKPIVNEQDFMEASKVIDTLIDADMIENPEQRQRALEILNAITILAIDYEKKHYPIPAPDPIEAIKERMKMLNLSQKDLALYFGGENRVSEVLNKKRSLSLRMIKELHKNLGISADVLIAY